MTTLIKALLPLLKRVALRLAREKLAGLLGRTKTQRSKGPSRDFPDNSDLGG